MAADTTSELFGGLGSVAAGHRERMKQLRESRRETFERGPSTDTLKSDPSALRMALKRSQVREIAARANPKSKDTETVFTAGSRRYARTDVYTPTISERASGVSKRATAKTGEWWDKNKGTVLLAGIGILGAYVVYTALTKPAEAPVAQAPKPPPPHPALPAHARARVTSAPPAHRTSFWPHHEPWGEHYGAPYGAFHERMAMPCPPGMLYQPYTGQCVPA